MVIGNGRLPQNLSFSYDNLNLEIAKNFNYLGIIFTRTGNFSQTKKHLADKALKAMYDVLKIERMYKLSIKCLLDLFDKMFKPILLYGCEVWGFSNNDILKKIHLKFCKILLNLKTSTPSYSMVNQGDTLYILILKSEPYATGQDLQLVNKQSILIYCIDYVVN